MGETSAELPHIAPAPAPAPEPGTASAPSYRRTLANRPFFLLWSSQLISQSGDFVFDVALLWLVLEVTGSIEAVTIVVVAATVPIVALGPFLGVYVDRWPRRTILIGTNLAEGALVAGLSAAVLAHDANLLLIVAVVFALGVGQQFVRVTSQALVPQTVGVADLGAANGLMTFSGSTIQIAGLAIGGVVVALLGPTLPIAYDAISFFAAAAIVTAMSAMVGRPAPSEGAATGFLAQFREGFQYIAHQPFMLQVISIGLVTNFAGNAVFALWAPYAKFVLHGGAATYGFLGAMIALGSIVGALAVGKLNIRSIAGPVIFAGLFAVGGLIIALGLTHSVPFAIAEALGVGVAVAAINVPLLTVVQGRVPPQLMGRAMSVLLSLILLASPIGAYLAGVIAEATSISFLYLLMGGLVVGVAAVGLAVMGEVRRITY